MSDRLAGRLMDAEVRKDTALLGDFARLYCRGNHADRERAALVSPGVDLGAYGRRVPVVCEECRELLAYAEKRRASCPRDPKPFCSYCDTHCYRPEMRERMREVMRYAGPRSMLHGHAVEGIRHLIEGRRHKAAERARAAGSD